jgi:pimeloyl-ACP methyl ester carboxylesterase
MRHRLLQALLFLPSRGARAPADVAGPGAQDVEIDTEDGERLHGWWVPARAACRGHVLLVPRQRRRRARPDPPRQAPRRRGLDVLVFDYRGYGASSGRPTVEGTRRDARAAHDALLARASGRRVLYLGESLGAAVALALAVERPPAGLVLQSAFTSVRDMAALHYPFVPRAVVPGVYDSLALVPRCGRRCSSCTASATRSSPRRTASGSSRRRRDPKAIHVFPRLGHNDLVDGAGEAWAKVIADWAGELPGPGERPPGA